MPLPAPVFSNCCITKWSVEHVVLPQEWLVPTSHVAISWALTSATMPPRPGVQMTQTPCVATSAYLLPTSQASTASCFARGSSGEVLWWVCLSVCLSVHKDNSRTTWAIFTKFFVHVAYVRGSVLLWHVYDKLHRLSTGRDDESAQHGRSVICGCLVAVCI